jgi:hypothetical protein
MINAHFNNVMANVLSEPVTRARPDWFRSQGRAGSAGRMA